MNSIFLKARKYSSKTSIYFASLRYLAYLYL